MEDEGAVYTVFEVLNSRGLDVDWLDKCKSLLMGLLYEKIQSVNHEKPEDAEVALKTHLGILHQYWANIYKTVGMRKIQGYEVVRFSATLKNIDKALRKVMSPESALDFFKEDCISVQKIIETTKHIEEVVLCLSKLYDDEKLKAVTDVSQARLLAVSIMLKYNNENNKKDREKLLNQWERTSFKIYTLFRKDSRSGVGDYISAARQVQLGEKSVNVLIKIIADIGKDFDINKIDEDFKNDWYNGYRKDIRYFFFKYEESLSKNPAQKIWNGIWNSNVDDTIEHVLPQNLNGEWSHFSKNEHEKYLNSIGNLCILSRGENTKALDKNFNGVNSKKEVYLNNLAIVSLRDIYYTDEKNKEERVVWDKEAIEERTERLLKFAKEQWKDLDV
ncbi:MAG: HNH endonuclease family protein [bacterium]|nr:HNH endonuclease family protein [bacterium]